MKIFALRLLPGQDLRKELYDFVAEKNITAGFILTCVGSLSKATIRPAGAGASKSFNKKYEIISLVGTFSRDGNHVHICLADSEGNTIGGHLKEGCIINTTAEIVIGETEEYTFSRELDKKTGFKELKISKK